MSEERRPDPDTLLRRLAGEEAPRCGRLKVFLGAAPGVGKTCDMLEAARARRAARPPRPGGGGRATGHAAPPRHADGPRVPRGRGRHGPDLGLPDLDGVEVARRIREGSNAAIIVLSARGRETDKIEALDAGADDYLAQLRHKLEVDPARPRYLPTETGGGYRIPLP